MQFNPNSNVTLFLSVRKGLEGCILNEIKHNKFLNNFYKIHKNKFQNSQDSNTHLTTNSDYYDYTVTEDITSYNTVTGLASLTNSLQLPEEFEDINNKWLRIGHQNNSTGNSEGKTPKSKTTVSVKSNNLRDYLDINEQKGGLEIKCNFEWLIKSSLFLKSAESIWIRIGNPFRCHTQDQLTTFVSKLPWISYFSSSDSIDKVPLRIISRNSKLWSSHIVRDCVTRGIKQSLNSDLKSENNNTTTQDKGENLNKTYSEDSCISVTINRNTCYAAIQFSGRLSPRFYNYLDNFNTNTEDTRTGSDKDIVCDTSKDYYSQIPLWSLSGIKKAISKSFNSSHYSTNLSETNLESYDSKRTNYIKFQKSLTNDFLDTSDSLIAAFLHNKHLLKAIDSDSTETIWDPFCGTGLVICELVSLVLSLPNYTLDNTNTITSLAKTFFTQNSTQIKSLFDQYTSDLGQKTKNFKIVGSDTSLVNLSEANSKILKFISYYNDIIDSSKFEANDSIFSKNSTLHQSYSKLPVTIHNCSPEKLSHYMTNATIVTKFPYIDSKDKGKFETIKLCKLFGQVISSKSDWKGVFVISRGNFFEYHSGLEWKTLVKSTNSNSEIKLLDFINFVVNITTTLFTYIIGGLEEPETLNQFRINSISSMKLTLYSILLLLFSLPNSYSFFFKSRNAPLKVFSGPIKVAIMGSTGSVGTQALDVIRNINKLESNSGPKFEVVALTANSNYKLLSQQVNEFRPEVCHILKNYEKMPELLKTKCKILNEKSDLMDLCRNFDYDIILMAISGCDGIEPTLAAAKSGKKIALSNKESVVSAGSLLSKVVKKSKTTVIPVDSEHNAIFQCLDHGTVDTRKSTYVCSISSQALAKVKNLILTSSGGPFNGKKYTEYKNLRSTDNINHPVWQMGSKITVDSSTMMNKALEVLEAHHLFGLPLDSIKILVHKECIVHSLVEFTDNSVLCQMYLPDMKLPISHALHWPNRTKNALPSLDLRGRNLSFKEADYENFPFLGLGYEVGRMGGLYPAVFNAANDVANDLFRSNKIDYEKLYQIVRETVESFNKPDLSDDILQDILFADSWAKDTANRMYSKVAI